VSEPSLDKRYGLRSKAPIPSPPRVEAEGGCGQGGKVAGLTAGEVGRGSPLCSGEDGADGGAGFVDLVIGECGVDDEHEAGLAEFLGYGQPLFGA